MLQVFVPVTYDIVVTLDDAKFQALDSCIEFIADAKIVYGLLQQAMWHNRGLPLNYLFFV